MVTTSAAKRLVPMMAFCEAPFDGTLDGTTAPSSSPAARGGAASSFSDDGVVTRRSMLAALAKEFPVLTSQRRRRQQVQRQASVEKRLVPMMAFCEAPFDGTLDGTATAPSSSSSLAVRSGASPSRQRRGDETCNAGAGSRQGASADVRGRYDGLTVLETIISE